MNDDKISKVVILDDNPLSISSYAEEYPENWKKIINAKEPKSQEITAEGEGAGNGSSFPLDTQSQKMSSSKTTDEIDRKVASGSDTLRGFVNTFPKDKYDFEEYGKDDEILKEVLIGLNTKILIPTSKQGYNKGILELVENRIKKAIQLSWEKATSRARQKYEEKFKNFQDTIKIYQDRENKKDAEFLEFLRFLRGNPIPFPAINKKIAELEKK